MISPQKWQKLKTQMQELEILESDLTEKFILGSGHGGQKIQKSASCVFLQHGPRKISVKCQESRSREDNRFYARRRLCEKIQEQVNQEKSARQQLMEKIRRQKKRRSRRTQQKILADKHKKGATKELRKPPNVDEE